MAIQLTSDPIISLADSKRLLSVQDDLQATLAINATTKKFLRFTGRSRINADDTTAIVERLRPVEANRIWLRASPVDVSGGKEITVERIADGQAQDTYTYTAGELDLVNEEEWAYVTPIGWAAQVTRDPAQWYRVTYFGGWTSVPGDVIAGALAQAQVELLRAAGKVGMDNLSRKGESVRYDRDSVVTEAEEAWAPYVVE